MCDYSLHGLPNRLALESEDLVAYRFSTGAVGLTSPAELRQAACSGSEKKTLWSAIKAAFLPPAVPEAPAVCIPPGARLQLTGIPASMQSELDVGPVETVTFTQISATVNAFHDAVRFQNGRQILLQVLKEGQLVRVLSLSPPESDDAVFKRESVSAETLV